MLIERIVSGGQTGVDRGALDAALELNVPHGGWCPLGRIAEDGWIPARYQLQEMQSPDYPPRTEQNVIDSDATLILFRDVRGTGRLIGGTRLTRQLAHKHDRPILLIDLQPDPSPDQVLKWLLSQQQIKTLNVAGPRESSAPGIQQQALEFVRRLLVGSCYG